MSNFPRFPQLRRPAFSPPAYYGRATAADAHARLDVVDQQLAAVSEAIEAAAQGQSELVRSVDQLTTSMSTLEKATTTTQDSLKKFISNDEAGKKALAEMIGAIIDQRTGGWVRTAVLAAVVSFPGWVPKLVELLRGFHG